jgi:hypothetical protein
MLYLPMDSDFNDDSVYGHTVTVEQSLVSPSNMTSNSAPSPYVASASISTEPDTNWRIWKAFDTYIGTSPTGNMGWLVNPSAAAWIKIDLGQAFPCAKYRIYSTSHNACPRDWKLEGSNDGSSWTTLDTQVDIGNWGANSYVQYTLASLSSAYRYYRVNITDWNSGYIAVGQVQIYGSPIIDTSEKEVGAGSGRFAGTKLYNGTFLTVTEPGENFYLHYNDFLFRFYMRLNSHPTADIGGEKYFFIIGQAYDVDNRWGVFYYEDDLYDPYFEQGIMVVGVNLGTLKCRISSDSEMDLDTWYKVEVMRFASKIFIKIDDVFQTVDGTDIGAKSFGTIGHPLIGKNNLSGYPQFFDGWLDEFEIWKFTEGNWMGINF